MDMNSTPDELSDIAIIRQILDGNVNAFEILLERYQNYVAVIVTKHVPRDKVEEVTHETFVRAYKSLKTYKAKKPFANWLSTIAVRRCYDFWREHYKRAETPVSSISDDTQVWMDRLLSGQSRETFSGQTEQREASDLLQWIMERLSPEERTVLTLTYLEEYSVAEAAEVLGWSVPNVKIRAFRARNKARKLLAKAKLDG